MSKSTITVDLVFGTDPGIVTVHLTGRSQPIVAGLLGVDTNADGEPVRVYLRSRVHGESSAEYLGWRPCGAITTIFEKVANQ